MTERNKNQPGYKKTKVGLIPEAWDVVRVKDCISKTRGIDPTKVHNKTFKYVDISSICNDTYRIQGHQSINSINAPSRARKEIKAKDILYATVRPYLKRIAIVPAELDGQVCSTGFCVLRCHSKKIDYNYLFNVLLSEWMTTKISKLQTGSNYPAVNDSDIHSQPIPLPHIKEQEKIAAILGKWDEGIEKVEKLIAAKQKLKKALCQQLLTGKKRFKEFEKQPWNSIELKKVLIPQIRAVVKPSKSFLALGIRSHGKGTFQKPNFEPQKIALEELYKVKTNDLIVNITFAWEGAIAIVNECDDDALVSHRFPTYVFDKQKGISEYFRHIILQKRFVYELGLVSPGGAGRNRVLSKKDFLKIKVNIPTIEEQQKIASVLNAADKKIELLSDKLEALKNQKKGLMQKLLTGGIRVKIN